ncbi:hypothetical protein [Mucilaginibacter ginkgonis]|uniref:Uncharacterized protein n=1 Tax=Mucilaginibacter ginkgonis TaxID=2682091 RepID=A0A6I4IN88_9SPHI|nr:hypothetical protein [Mucilaginibacter ginkgonis]QQL51371.1 hypothetical protein GO620_007985 [Mucilaginibacter ginkgonis]
MPKILTLKFLVVTAIIAALTSLFSPVVDAQCVIKKVKRNGVIFSEIPERYIYNRTTTDYNALSLILSQTVKSNGPAYTLNLKFAFSNILRKGQWLVINFTSGEQIKLPMRFVAIGKTDNPNIHLNSYSVDLPSDIIQKLAATPVKTIEINSAFNFKFSEVFAPDESLFTEMFRCFQPALQ